MSKSKISRKLAPESEGSGEVKILVSLKSSAIDPNNDCHIPSIVDHIYYAVEDYIISKSMSAASYTIEIEEL